jgi:hypothetical protein
LLNHWLRITPLAGSGRSEQEQTLRSEIAGRLGRGLCSPGLWALLLLFGIAFPLFSQEFVPEKVVFPITDFKPDVKRLTPFSMKFGTGFCLDENCRFVGTNYHVADIMGKSVRIKGVSSAVRYVDSGPDDVGAQNITVGGVDSLKYTPAHDLAIYEMHHPIKGFHGIGFDADVLEGSFEADIYAYPLEWKPKRGLFHWHGKFLGPTPEGLLAFSYEEGRVRSGGSGGIIVASETKKIVGILCGFPAGKDRVVLAVPVKELADFVARAQPFLQASLFPKTVFVSPVGPDLYPPYVWTDADDSPDNYVQRYEESKLRSTARHLADSMHNFVASQTFAWGHDNREPEWTDAYETLVVDGWQRWRHPGKRKFSDQIPFPPTSDWLLPGPMWLEFPDRIGTEKRLKIHKAPDAFVGGRNINVFQYAAKAADKVCYFEYYMILFRKIKSYDCHGEVWLDESGIILRISQTLELTGPDYNYWAVMTYGWQEIDGTQRLVPVSMATQVANRNIAWCRGLFTDYHMFDVSSHIVLPDQPEKVAVSPH